MDKTKIEWCDSTWNPVTGCYHDCPYCYARSMVERFGRAGYGKVLEAGDVLEIFDPFKDENGKRIAYPTGFTPTLHRYRLNDYKDKTGRTIFVCSMADLFGDWVPDSWIEEVFAACKAAPQHRYLFLTKNPQRYIDLAEKNALPEDDNMWYGTTVTTPDKEYFFSSNHNNFVSIEPILDAFPIEHPSIGHIKWIILGAETGNRKDKVTPKREWLNGILDAHTRYGPAIFMKDSLIPIIGEENMRREFPWG